MKTKIHFGPKAISKPEPSWANKIIGAVLILLPIVHHIVQEDPAISDLTEQRIILYTDYTAAAIIALAKLFGVTKTNESS